MAVLTPRLSTPESRIRVLREFVRVKVFTIICFFTIFFLKFWPLQYTLCLLLVVMSFFSTFTVLLLCKMMVVDVVKDNWAMCVNHYLLSVDEGLHSINQGQPSLQLYLEHKRPALLVAIYSSYGLWTTGASLCWSRLRCSCLCFCSATHGVHVSINTWIQVWDGQRRRAV